MSLTSSFSIHYSEFVRDPSPALPLTRYRPFSLTLLRLLSDTVRGRLPVSRSRTRLLARRRKGTLTLPLTRTLSFTLTVSRTRTRTLTLRLPVPLPGTRTLRVPVRGTASVITAKIMAPVTSPAT